MGIARSVRDNAISVCEDRLDTLEQVKTMLNSKYPDIDKILDREISKAYSTWNVLDQLKIAK